MPNKNTPSALERVQKLHERITKRGLLMEEVTNDNVINATFLLELMELENDNNVFATKLRERTIEHVLNLLIERQQADLNELAKFKITDDSNTQS